MLFRLSDGSWIDPRRVASVIPCDAQEPVLSIAGVVVSPGVRPRLDVLLQGQPPFTVYHASFHEARDEAARIAKAANTLGDDAEVWDAVQRYVTVCGGAPRNASAEEVAKVKEALLIGLS